jgi:hypothetical protein
MVKIPKVCKGSVKRIDWGLLRLYSDVLLQSAFADFNFLQMSIAIFRCKLKTVPFTNPICVVTIMLRILITGSALWAKPDGIARLAVAH